MRLAIQLYRIGYNEEPLELLFNRLRRDLTAVDGRARKIFQEILAALDTGDTLASKCRCQLYMPLY